MCLLTIFAIYDLGFWLSSNHFAGRSREETLLDIRAACGYISYFVPVFAISIGLFFSAKQDGVDTLRPILQNDAPLRYSLIGALLASAAAMLFLPVQYTTREDEGEAHKMSPALQSCFSFVMFLEKTAVVLVTYSILRIFLALFPGAGTH